MLDIKKFKSAIHKHDVYRPNLFVVEVGVPKCFSNSLYPGMKDLYCRTDNMRLLSLFCKAVNTPGISLSLADNRRFGIGPNIKMPIGTNYTDVTMTFINDGESILKDFFDMWIYCVNAYASDKGVAGEDYLHQFRYRDVYQTDASIITLKGDPNQFGSVLGDLAQGALSVAAAVGGVPFVSSLLGGGLFTPSKMLKEIRRTKLIGMYPTSVSDVTHSYDSTNIYSEFSVNFTYASMYFEKKS